MNERTIFTDALEVPPDARAAFLDAACVGDPALSAQNDASFLAYGATPLSCQTGCGVNPGPPVFAQPGSLFRRDAAPADKPVQTFPGLKFGWGA